MVEKEPNECIHPDVHVLRGNETLKTHFARANIHMLQGHRSSLYIKFHMYPDGIDQVAYVINALIDTGCEINLIKSGFLPYRYFQRSTSTLRLVAANGGRLGGGGRKTRQDLYTVGLDLKGEKLTFKYPPYFMRQKLHVMQNSHINGWQPIT